MKTNQRQAALRAALFGADGKAVAIDRVELEVLEAGRVRWSVWSAGRRVFSTVAKAEDREAMYATTRVMIETMARGHAEAGWPPAGGRG